jgi:hypothetical protein
VRGDDTCVVLVTLLVCTIKDGGRAHEPRQSSRASGRWSWRREGTRVTGGAFGARPVSRLAVLLQAGTKPGAASTFPSSHQFLSRLLLGRLGLGQRLKSNYTCPTTPLLRCTSCAALCLAWCALVILVPSPLPRVQSPPRPLRSRPSTVPALHQRSGPGWSPSPPV